MIDCDYTTDGPPWHCMECNHEQSVSQTLHRNCRNTEPADRRAYLEASTASSGLSSVPPAETARRIECCVECPSLVDQACLELFNASGECRKKAVRLHIRRLLGRWTPCERMTEHATSQNAVDSS